MSIVLQTSETSHFFAPFFPSYLRGQGCLQGRARCLGLRARCLNGQLTVILLLRMKSPSEPFAPPRHTQERQFLRVKVNLPKSLTGRKWRGHTSCERCSATQCGRGRCKGSTLKHRILSTQLLTLPDMIWFQLLLLYIFVFIIYIIIYLSRKENKKYIDILYYT